MNKRLLIYIVILIFATIPFSAIAYASECDEINASESKLCLDDSNFKSSSENIDISKEYFIFIEKDAYDYTGSAIEPAVTVESNAQDKLVPGIDYELTYSNNINPGVATIRATGKGHYTGVVSANFNINTPTELFAINDTISLYKTGTKILTQGNDYAINNPVGGITFTSSNKNVATISSSGKITAKKKGTTTITIKNNIVTCKIIVEVRNPYLTANKKTIYKGEAYTLKVIGKIGKAKYSTNKKSVATVSTSGKIKVKKAGKAIITVKTNGIKLKCKVTALVVNKKASAKTMYKYFIRQGYPFENASFKRYTTKEDIFSNKSTAEFRIYNEYEDEYEDEYDYETVVIHVYKSVSNAKKKSKYVHKFDRTFLKTNVYRVGKVVVTADTEINSQDWKKIKNGLYRISKGKLPTAY